MPARLTLAARVAFATAMEQSMPAMPSATAAERELHRPDIEREQARPVQ